MSIHMIVSDLDDSLLDPQGCVTPRTVAALRRAVDAGARVILASGRMVQSIEPHYRQIDPHAPIIAFNGAVTYDFEAARPVTQFPIAPDDAREVCRMARSLNLHIQSYHEEGYIFEEENIRTRRYAKAIGGFEGRAVHCPLEDFIDRGAYKLLAIDEPERIAQLLPRFREAFGGRLSCAISRPNYIEFNAPNVDKGRALESLCGALGVPLEGVAAFGDAQNDLPMLLKAGRGYAVANARPEVLEKAAYIAPSNAEDGVAQVVEQLLDAGEICGL